MAKISEKLQYQKGNWTSEKKLEDNLNFGLKKLVKKGVSDNITNIDNIKKTS